MTTRARQPGLLVPAICLAGVVLFSALGVWQVERRAWKLDLIARVDARIHAQPAAMPAASTWASVPPRSLEYRKMRATGVFLNDRETLVDALTELGKGYWVVTPLRTAQGIVLVNRGFVPPAFRRPETRPAAQPAGAVTITGLARLTEPGGRFLRSNRPDEDRWYSRDVAAIARRRELGPVAPFFLDADATPNAGGWPIGGLTVVHFRNAHLIYAITWFGLAILSLAGFLFALKLRREARGRGPAITRRSLSDATGLDRS